MERVVVFVVLRQMDGSEDTPLVLPPAMSVQIPLVVPQIPVIVSLDELLETRNAILALEEKDRKQLMALVNIDETQLREKLYAWASLDFIDSYVLYEIQLSSKCSDGVCRGCIEYIIYLGTTFDLASTIHSIQQRLPGMTLSYSYTTDHKFRVHVSKTN